MTTTSNSKGWNIVLWTVQIILAGMFLMAGSTKATKPLNELTAMMPWTADVALPLVRFIGVSEMLGALGLLLPALLRIKPVFTPVAASALLLVMVMAAIFHLTRGEFSGVGFNILLGTFAAFIAWGRFSKAPVAQR